MIYLPVLNIDDLSMVTWIVDNFPETGKIKDTNGDLPIHFASAGGQSGSLLFLLELLKHQPATIIVN